MKLEIGQMGEKYDQKTRREAVYRAIMSRNPMLIDLILQVAEPQDLEGNESLVMRYKVKQGDHEFVRENFAERKNGTSDTIKLYIEIAIQNRDKKMLEILFEKGASKTWALGNAFMKCKMEEILFLLDAGCELNYNKAIQKISEGGSNKATGVLTWVFEMAPPKSIDKDKYKSAIRVAKIYGRDIISSYMEVCLNLEIYQSKFC